MWKKLSQMMSRALGAATAGPRRLPPGARRFRPEIECLEDRAVPATFTVTTTRDVVGSDGRLSLREAISAANAHPGADIILLPAGVYRLALAGADDTNAKGDLDVLGTTLFKGAGTGATVIDGQRLDRVFDIRGTGPSSIRATFQGLTVRNGLADAGGGGGIRVGNADLWLQDSVITGNRTSGDGGGISNAAMPGTGNVTLAHTTIDHNTAVRGGGLRIQANGQNQGSVLNAIGSTIRRNIAQVAGGILAGQVNLNGCAVNGNIASEDTGGLEATTANLTHCTISGNSAGGDGGGVDAGTATLTSSTISGNTAGGDGGGIEANTVTLRSSVVSGNFAYGDGGGLLADTATLTGSAVSGNTSGGDGGGVHFGTATLTNSTVTGNNARRNGGGIWGLNSVELTNSTASGNHAIGGGGLFATTTATLTNSTVSGNFAFDGAGISGGSAKLTSSTVSGNHANRDGGAIFASLATLTGSTVSGNTAGNDAGGLEVETANLTNSTVSGNTAGHDGGGIYARSLTLLNVTITDNSAHDGGGVFLRTGGTSSVRNSIIAANLVNLDGTGADVSGAFTSGGHNLIGDGSAATGFINGARGDQVGTAANPIDPRLGALANNGGPTRTHALLAGSPAIDRGDNTDAPATDQRGGPRSKDGDGDGSRIVDIGAFER